MPNPKLLIIQDMNLFNFYWQENKQHIIAVLKHINDEYGVDLEISDSSYGNDSSPSLEIVAMKRKYQLFLPNSWRNDGEETTNFTLIHAEDYGSNEYFESYDCLEEFIEHIIKKSNANQHLID